jgi:hypothetical protein
MNNTFAFYNIRSINIDGCLWLSLDDLKTFYGENIDLSKMDSTDVQKWRGPDPEKEGESLEFQLIRLDGLAALRCKHNYTYNPPTDFCNPDNSIQSNENGKTDEKKNTVKITLDPIEEPQKAEDIQKEESIEQAPEIQKAEPQQNEDAASHGLVVTDAGMIRRFQEVQEMDAMKQKVHTYLNKTLPSDWQKLSAEERILYLDDPASSGRLVRDRVILEEIILECLRRPQDMTNLSLQNALTAIMDSFPEWQYVRSVKPYKPYKRGIGYKRIY